MITKNLSQIKHKLINVLKHPLILGTMILTASGFLSRLIGFFYRIYLSRLFGEENMGIYQLITPVISLSFALCAAGYQTAVSKLAAELAAKDSIPYAPSTKRPLWIALAISLPLSFLCSFITFSLAVPIGNILLKEPRTIPLLQIIAFSFPFVGIHACLNGWFYGMKKAGLPSAAQLIEQLTRVLCVYFITARDIHAGRTPNVSVAVMGLTLGEFVSMAFAILTFLPYHKKRTSQSIKGMTHSVPPVKYTILYRNLLDTAIPLTANRIVLTFLGSAENVAIPEMLRKYGYDTQTALSVYGVLTGMALPLIFFPNAVTSSLAVMLLPMISENHCLGRMDKVRLLTKRVLKYCLALGGICLLIFVSSGSFVGSALFHSSMAGQCIRTLGFICPFLYLDTALSAILQGMGESKRLFFINIISLGTRLFFVYLIVPLYGIKGYLWGMLAGQLLLSALCLLCLKDSFQSSKKDS